MCSTDSEIPKHQNTLLLVVNIVIIKQCHFWMFYCWLYKQYKVEVINNNSPFNSLNKKKTNLSVNGTVDTGIATRVGGTDTLWTGNWVVGRQNLQTKWGGWWTRTLKHTKRVGRLADSNPKAETWAVGGHTPPKNQTTVKNVRGEHLDKWIMRSNTLPIALNFIWSTSPVVRSGCLLCIPYLYSVLLMSIFTNSNIGATRLEMLCPNAIKLTTHLPETVFWSSTKMYHQWWERGSRPPANILL